MIGNHFIAVVGNLTSDPELKFAESGTAVAKLSIAVNDGRRDDPKAKTIYHRCTAFNQMAENIAESLHKGDQVLALLRLDPWEREIETADGTKTITQVDYIVDEIGPGLRFATAKIAKVSHNDRGGDRDEREDRGRGNSRDDDREPARGSRGNGRGSARDEATDDGDEPQRNGRGNGRATASAGRGSSRGSGRGADSPF